MTRDEFKKLNIGDRCFIKGYDDRYTNTEVLSIDRYFNKLTVLLRSTPIHYSKIYLKLKPHQRSGCFVGTFKI